MVESRPHPLDWHALKEGFFRLAELEPSEREDALVRLAGEDPQMARELEALFAADGERVGPLERALGGEPRVDALLGAAVGPWRLVAGLARGGTAEVYRGEPTEGDGAAVAVKVLNAGWASSEVLRRFALERRALGAMSHPNIVRLLGAEVLEDGRPALVMELVEGVPIDRYCAEGGLGARAICRLFLEVAEAVRHAHAQLVVHRDLKPANVLVSADGAPKVLDFGVVKLLAPESGDTTTHPGWVAPLTARYASPEQWEGAPITTASDVYSLGVLLGELLEGAGAPVARDLESIVRRASEEDPRLRYPSVESLGEDLQRYLGREPVRARRGTKLYRASRFLRRHRWSAAVSALLLAALVGALFVLHGQWRRAQAAEALGWRAHAQALQVSIFFHRLFDAADAENWSSDPGLVAALEEAAARVGEDLVDYPEAEGRVRFSIATLYHELGRHGEALVHAERALELALADGGFDESDHRVMRSLIDAIRSAGEGEGSG